MHHHAASHDHSTRVSAYSFGGGDQSRLQHRHRVNHSNGLGRNVSVYVLQGWNELSDFERVQRFGWRLLHDHGEGRKWLHYDYGRDRDYSNAGDNVIE